MFWGPVLAATSTRYTIAGGQWADAPGIRLSGPSRASLVFEGAPIRTLTGSASP